MEAKAIYLYRATKKEQNLNGIKVLYHSWNGALLFYKYKLKENNQNIQLITNTSLLKINDEVLVSSDSLKDDLVNKFKVIEIDSYGYAIVYKINGKK